VSPLLGKSFRERNPVRVAIVGTVVILLLLTFAFKFNAIQSHFTERGYSADFTETGGLKGGEQVRINGLPVGKVGSVTLRPGHVRVSFKVQKGISLGDTTRATISTATVLGTKVIELSPSGSGHLKGGAEIPLARTTSPYDITDALQQLTTESSQLNTKQLAASFTTLSKAFGTSAPEVAQTLSGVSRLSETIASRDSALQTLLANTKGVTQILADRKRQFVTLFADGNQLLEQLYAQRDAYQSLLQNVTYVVSQLQGLVNDNQATLKPALAQLDSVVDILNSHSSDIVAGINGLKRYATGLGEAVGGGPFFYAFVQNLTATNLLTVDQKTLISGVLGNLGGGTTAVGGAR
jgi:phospholipid/cholesterol/gamma-HCH transport system substrate-binding protein